MLDKNEHKEKTAKHPKQNQSKWKKRNQHVFTTATCITIAPGFRD